MKTPELSPIFPYQSLTIAEIREETAGFRTIIFAEGHDLLYESGQFLTLVDNRGSQEIRRSYSITSAPVLNERLSIAVKRIDNGYFSRNLVDRARTGDLLVTSGVGGFFRLPENIKLFETVFFFAAGSGIAPILSLIKTVLRLYPDISIFLIYSNQSVAATAFYDELNQMQKRFPKQFHIDFLFSSESDLRRARLNRDLLLELLNTNRYQRGKTLFYACGPESYMRMIRFYLVEEGFPDENIKKEDFNPGNRKITDRIPPDKNDYPVQLQLRGELFVIPVHYPESILQAARKFKLNLPYSCETGKCGSCAALCLSGKVWLSNNEVLTEKDLTNGLTLTCTGHPQSHEVILKIG